ncbi:MAG: maleylacetate reductase [Sporichthyaceae bacterium]
MHPFVHEALPGRVVFGVGSVASLPEELDRLGCARALLVTEARGKAVGDEAAERLGARAVLRIAEVRQHVPAEDVAAALDLIAGQEIDSLVAIGGGSAIGLAKALAATLAVPIVAVPTTYSGSELTAYYGVTEGGHKRTRRDLRVLPAVVVYDPVLTVPLRAPVTAASGMNALAHCVEALWARDASPISSLLAEEAIRALARGIPGSVADGGDLDARSDALYGAYLAGAVLGTTTIALHHKLAHVVGGSYNLPHAPTHSALLPHVVAYNAPAAPEAVRRIAAALGAADAPGGLWDLAVAVGAPTSLADLGMDEAKLAEAAGFTATGDWWNPRPVSAEGVLEILRGAYAGTRP